MWAGSAMTGGTFRAGSALAGALNPAPVAWLALGAAALAAGWLPSAVAAIGALPVVGGFLLNVLAESMHAPRALAWLSPFSHISSVPTELPNWPAIAVFLLLGAVLTAAGIAGFRRRDLAS